MLHEQQPQSHRKAPPRPSQRQATPPPPTPPTPTETHHPRRQSTPRRAPRVGRRSHYLGRFRDRPLTINAHLPYVRHGCHPQQRRIYTATSTRSNNSPDAQCKEIPQVQPTPQTKKRPSSKLRPAYLVSCYHGGWLLDTYTVQQREPLTYSSQQETKGNKTEFRSRIPSS